MNISALSAQIQDLMEDAYRAGWEAGKASVEWKRSKEDVERALTEAVNSEVIPMDF